MAKKKKGALQFEAHYQALFGEHWPSLRQALENPVHHVFRVNSFCDQTWLQDNLKNHEVVENLPGCRKVTQTKVIPKDSAGLFAFYCLDGASLFPVKALQVEEGNHVLDLCAAPGGKTLMMLEKVGELGSLLANDRSKSRLARLKKVMKEYVPLSFQSQIQITCFEGSKWRFHDREKFDRVLVDAPCSSERHLLHDADEMKKWTSSRINQLAKRQAGLLLSAVDVLRPGGRVVYSTCALSPKENDDVVAKVLEKRSDCLEMEPQSEKIGEPTSLGWSILPDKTSWGPIYYSVLKKLEPQ